MVGRRRAFTIATLVISSASGPRGLSCEAGAAFSTNDEAKERDDVGDERTGIECPRRHVPEWSDDGHHVVCRASDGSMNWVCPKLWSRTPIDQPTPPYCIPPKVSLIMNRLLVVVVVLSTSNSVDEFRRTQDHQSMCCVRVNGSV